MRTIDYVFVKIKQKLREILISKVWTPKKWPLGLDFFENNFKNLKAILKF